MDMAFVNALNASSSFPPHDPWMAGEDLNYYYLGHLAMAMLDPAHRRRARRGLQPRARAAVRRSSAVAVFTLAGTLWAAARPRLDTVRGGPVSAGLMAVVACIVLGNLAGVRELARRGQPAGRLRLVRRVARDHGHDQRVPLVLVPARRHARARARAPVHAARARRSRCRSRSPGPRGDAVWRGVAEALAAGLAIGALYAINSWSYPAAAGCWCWRSRPGCDRPTSAGRRAVRARLARARAAGERRADAALLAQLRPGGARDRLGEGARAVHPFRSATRLLLYGLFVGPLAAAFAARVLATRRPVRRSCWGVIARAFVLLAAGAVRLRRRGRRSAPRSASRWAR